MRVIAATHNPGKLEEFRRILEPLGFQVVSEKEIGLSLEVEETGTTFAQNARLKAMAVYEATGLAALADDSGLCVEALGLRPGVYSARYGGEDADYEKKMALLLGELKGKENRAAYFESAVCLVRSPGDVLECSGRVYGVIADAPRGTSGFGYDPLFQVGDRTIGEMTAGEKDAISHRARALRALEERLRAERSEGDKIC